MADLRKSHRRAPGIPPGLPRSASLEERFWSRVDRSAGLLGCWPWSGAHNLDGYGQYRVGGRGGVSWLVHRLAWVLANGPLPEDTSRGSGGTLVLHSCDNPPCCNPSHLFLGTHRDNIDDMLAKRAAMAQDGAMNPTQYAASRRARGLPGGTPKAVYDAMVEGKFLRTYVHRT